MIENEYRGGSSEAEGTGIVAVRHELGVKPGSVQVTAKRKTAEVTFEVTYVDKSAFAVKTFPPEWEGTVIWRVESPQSFTDAA